MTAERVGKDLKAFLKEELKGSPLLVLLPFLMPILMKFLEAWLNKHDVTPRAEA